MRGEEVNFKERMELASFSSENVMKNLLERGFTRVFNGIFWNKNDHQDSENWAKYIRFQDILKKGG